MTNKCYSWIKARKNSLALYLIAAGIATVTTLANRNICKKDSYLVEHPSEIKRYMENADSFKDLSSRVDRICNENLHRYLEPNWKIKMFGGREFIVFDNDARNKAWGKAFDELKTNDSYRPTFSEYEMLRQSVYSDSRKCFNYFFDKEMPIAGLGYGSAFAVFLVGCAALADEINKMKKMKKMKGGNKKHGRKS